LEFKARGFGAQPRVGSILLFFLGETRLGRTIWIVDAHRVGKRLIVHADEKLSAFVELESRGRITTFILDKPTRCLAVCSHSVTTFIFISGSNAWSIHNSNDEFTEVSVSTSAGGATVRWLSYSRFGTCLFLSWPLLPIPLPRPLLFVSL